MYVGRQSAKRLIGRGIKCGEKNANSIPAINARVNLRNGKEDHRKTLPTEESGCLDFSTVY